MIHITMLMEDVAIVATYQQAVTLDKKTGLPTENEYRWVGRCSDMLSGKGMTFSWSGEQMAAIQALGLHAVGENKSPGYDVTKSRKRPSPGGPRKCVRFLNQWSQTGLSLDQIP